MNKRRLECHAGLYRPVPTGPSREGVRIVFWSPLELTFSWADDGTFGIVLAVVVVWVQVGWFERDDDGAAE